MNCMKCGKETRNDQTFCDDCLEIMAQYPVKPGTAVRIPRRKDYEDKPVRRKKEVTPEEQIETLSNMVQWLTIAVVTLMAAMVLMGMFILKDYLLPQPGTEAPIPRNYTVISEQDKILR